MSRLLEMLTVGSEQSILDAVKCIESGDLQIAFVVEADQQWFE